MALKNAACVAGGTVVNVAVYDEATSGPWLDAVTSDYDSILIVDEAGIGWEEYEPGKVRMPQPAPDCVWTGTEWDCPTPEPETP